MKQKLLLILFIGLFVSCTTKRNLTYFSDLHQNDTFKTAIVNAHEPKIQEGDILSITMSSLDAASNALFNAGVLQNFDGRSSSGSTSLGKEGFLVGKDGAVNYPVIGKIKLSGYTISEAHEVLRNELLTYVKEPIVNIRYLNFKVTVIGEVNRPGSFTMDNDRVNVLEALGSAGDMTSFGLRENVLIIRETDGNRQMARLNLNSSTAFDSPFFYLQQNDLIYVQPDVKKEKQAGRDNYLLVTTMSVASFLILAFVRLF